MSDVQLALDGAAFDGLVQIEELAGQGMITLRGDLADDTIRASVNGLFGIDIPAQRGTAFAGDTGALWMSPDEMLLLCPYEGARAMADELAEKVKDAHALVVNVSDARTVFRLKGSMLREVIAKLAPADMSPGVFEPGELRRTRLAQVAAAFWMDDARTARVVCFRSVAGYVFGLLSTSADDASAVNHFTR